MPDIDGIPDPPGLAIEDTRKAAAFGARRIDMSEETPDKASGQEDVRLGDNDVIEISGSAYLRLLAIQDEVIQAR